MHMLQSLFHAISVKINVSNVCIYQPISAEIYLLATYSTLAQEYHVHYMRVSQHIFCFALSDPADIYYFPHIAYWPRYIMCAQHVLADIYFSALHAVQLTYIICHCKHTSRHILPPTASILAQLVSTIMSSFSACL